MPSATLMLLLWLARRIRPIGLAFAAYRTWRRLPPQHRRRIVLTARQHGPRLATALTRRRRHALS